MVPDRTNLDNSQRLEDLQRNAASRRNGIFIVVTIFITCLVGLLYVYRNFPKLDANERNHIKLPTNIEDAQLLGKVLANYTDKYYFEVLIAIILTFLFLQSFAIPGTLFLSILCGFLFSFPIALLVICFCSATGASFCYLVSNRFLRSLITHYFPDQVKKYTDLVRKHKDNLFNYMLFLRMTPILPNWFINITSPVVQVPIYTFWIGTFIGVAPPSIVAIQAGQTLLELTSSSGTWSWTSVIVLGALAVASLIPVFLKDKLKKKFA
uniref:VTT domain-containing protein n=1 Tax=Clastoptera arizonana TaxID=38151 RepID=A0A1B6BZU7_9HEMI